MEISRQNEVETTPQCRNSPDVMETTQDTSVTAQPVVDNSFTHRDHIVTQGT